MNKRTAREIIVKDNILSNKKLNTKIGTVENRDFPQTVYINISFWIKPKENIIEHNETTRENLEMRLKNILNKKLIKFLENNYYFPKERENIYIYNIPENFNYNNKSNFISLEAYLHTLNIKSEKKYPLNIKKNTELFMECVRISNYLGEEVKGLENQFYINKNSKIQNM